VSYHTLNSVQTVDLKEEAVYNGEVFPAGSYDFEVDGRYWTGFDRQHPLEGPARGLAWTGTAHALVAELGVGTVTHSTLQLGLAFAGTLAAIGLTLLLAGGGMYWASRGKGEELVMTITEDARKSVTV
jgi:hypothetical protein